MNLLNLFSINLFILLGAIILDVLFGEPPSKLHPVVYIGKVITFFEQLYYPMKNKRMGGLLLVISTLIVVIFSTLIIAILLLQINVLLYIIFCLYLSFAFISIRSLNEHSLRIYKNLIEHNLEDAKNALALIVSRDVSIMDKDKIISSTVESIAENFVDGILSPLFYMIMCGPLGGLVYKTINTLDSMVGYKNDKYIKFGFFAAKCDDLLNFIPARISIIFTSIASFICENNLSDTISSFFTYRLHHESPNAGHSMAAFAGALNIALGGPTYYFGKLVNKPMIGMGKKNNFDTTLITDAIKLMNVASLIFLYIIIIFIVIIN